LGWLGAQSGGKCLNSLTDVHFQTSITTTVAKSPEHSSRLGVKTAQVAVRYFGQSKGGPKMEVSMTSLNYRSSRPDSWTVPRPYSDVSLRRMKFGPIQPMDEDRGFFWRLFHR
jgi:hypothetical protein